MSFAVEFYSFDKRANSTARPVSSGIKLYNGDLVEECGMFRPIIRFNLDDVPTYKPSDDKLPNEEMTIAINRWNYMYIRQFRRFYFITEWTYDRGFWICQGREDVLASWRDQIGEMEEYVVRSNQAFDGSIIDYVYPATTTVTKQQVPLTIQPTMQSDMNANPSYIIGITGNDGSFGSVNYYYMDAADLHNFMNFLTSDTDWLQIPEEIVETVRGYIGDNSISYTTKVPQLESLLRAQINPIQYVVSSLWLPFTPRHVEGFDYVKLGYWTLPAAAKKVANNIELLSDSVQVPKHPQSAARGKYLNFAPFTRYTMNCGSFGSFPLDNAKLQDVTSLDFFLLVDVITGEGRIRIESASHTSGNIIYEASGQVGVPITLSQISRNYIGAVSSIGTSVAAATKSVTNLDFIGTIANAATGVGNALDNLLPSVVNSGGQGSSVHNYLPWTLEAEFMNMVPDDNENRGRPLCQKRKISELKGYMQIADADVHLPATDSELDTIKSYMERGFWWQ